MDSHPTNHIVTINISSQSRVSLFENSYAPGVKKNKQEYT